MQPNIEMLLTDLRHLLGDLGRGGGLSSGSVYDTAQVTRLAPPEQGIWPAVEWLLAQQRRDGGWGETAAPHARDTPSLAAVLALRQHATRKPVREAVEAGLAFLRRQASYWDGPLPEDLPVGVELLLPNLLRDAAELSLPTEPYRDLIALGKRRRELIQRTRPGAGTTAAHSWEAWGTSPDPAIIDPTGSVGHSPSATAAWIAAARGIPQLEDQRTAAQRYLARAAAATGENTPGIVPMAWPIDRFEAIFALYPLLMAGLLNHSALTAQVRARLDELATCLRPKGIGFSDHFEPDGDDTAAALALLKSCGYPVNRATLHHYERDSHFCTYPYELQISLSASARSVHTLLLAGENVARHAANLASHQHPDGRWRGDKWNCSWLYTTGQVVQALVLAGGHRDSLGRALDAILAHQQPDGGWGAERSSLTETAYAVLALHTLSADPDFAARSAGPLARARAMMHTEYRPFHRSDDCYWIAKVIYRPYRIDRAFELSAMLALELYHEPPPH